MLHQCGVGEQKEFSGRVLYCDYVNNGMTQVTQMLVFLITIKLSTSVSEPTGSEPTPQSPMREVGTIALWPQARACFVSVERGKKREGFDSWMVWK